MSQTTQDLKSSNSSLERQPLASNQSSEQLIERTKRAAEDLRGSANDITKLWMLKGSEELMDNIHEVLRDIEEQSHRIQLTIKTSRPVYDKLKNLSDSINDTSIFFEKVKNTKVMFISKGKLKREMIRLHQALKAKCTDLMSAVSLVLLSNQSLQAAPAPVPSISKSVTVAAAPTTVIEYRDRPPDPKLKINEMYDEGCRWYYGINRPKNFILAHDEFIKAAEHKHAESVTMIALMFKNGHGVDKDYSKFKHWLKRGVESNIPSSKYHYALILITKVWT